MRGLPDQADSQPRGLVCQRRQAQPKGNIRMIQPSLKKIIIILNDLLNSCGANTHIYRFKSAMGLSLVSL